MSFSKLRRAKSKNFVEPIEMSNHFKCLDQSANYLAYLSARREWSRSDPSKVQPSNHKGTSS